MPRVFVSEGDIDGSRVTVTGDEAHHLATVLRLRVGDRFTAVSPDGRAHEVLISAASRSRVVGEIARSEAIESETRLRLTLYQAIPRGKRFALILQKCTELGVARFVPVITAHTVVEVREGDAAQRVERWTKITREACKQCGRATCPQVSPPLAWKQALSDWQSSGVPGLLLHERLAGASEGERGTLRDVLARYGEARALALFVGPEGGFSAEESAAGVGAGLVEAPLGARILRAETAAIVAAALCLYEAGDI